MYKNILLIFFLVQFLRMEIFKIEIYTPLGVVKCDQRKAERVPFIILFYVLTFVLIYCVLCSLLVFTARRLFVMVLFHLFLSERVM